MRVVRGVAAGLVGAAWAVSGCGDGDSSQVDGAAQTDAGDAGDIGDAARDSVTDRPPTSTELVVRVVDSKTGQRLPAKLFFWKDGQAVNFARYKDPPFCSGTGSSLQEIGTGGALATWNGIGLWRGEATIPVGKTWPLKADDCNPKAGSISLDFGTYTIKASRGSEYEIAEATIELKQRQGAVVLTLPLAHTVDTSGYLSADLHIHSSPGSGDSSVTGENRVKTAVAVGLEILVSSDHDWITDLGEPIKKLWPDPGDPAPIASVVGSEASGNGGHFNVIPLPYEPTKPRNGALPGNETSTVPAGTLFERLHALPGKPLVQANHPRLGFAAYFDAEVCGPGGWSNRATLPPCSTAFDSIEILTGWQSCERKIRQHLDDWYGLMKLGVIATAVASSDSHYDSGLLAGFPRSYMRLSHDDVTQFREDEFVTAMRKQAVVLTTGPFLTMVVDGTGREGDIIDGKKGSVQVKVRMQHPGWMKVDTVRILVDGQTVKSFAAGNSGGMLEATETITVAQDAALTAEAQGTEVLPDWLVGDFVHTNRLPNGDLFCPNAGAPGVIPFALTNPVFVDVDGDGKFKQWIRAAAERARPAEFWLPSLTGDVDCDPMRAYRKRQ